MAKNLRFVINKYVHLSKVHKQTSNVHFSKSTTALSCIFYFFFFFFFEVHKNKISYDLFKHPLNRDKYSFHRFVNKPFYSCGGWIPLKGL